MGSSSNVFMRWGGFILKVFMYLFNKKSRAVFGGSVQCTSRKRWVFLCFFKQFPNCHRGSLHKWGWLSRPYPNLTPQYWGAHSCPSHSTWAHVCPLSSRPDVSLGRDTPKCCPSLMGSQRWWCDIQATLSIWVFLLSRTKTGYAASYNTQQTNPGFILLLSPDIFSAPTIWACNRKTFIA